MADLKQYKERADRILDRMDEERGAMKDLMQEVKSAGFDAKIFRRVLKESRMDAEKLREHETLHHAYQLELGLI